MRPTPSGSSLIGVRDFDSGMKRSAPSRPTTPSGTLMRKIIRQPVPSRSAETSQPARIGPAMAARPMIGPKAAKAPPISLGGKTVLIMPEPLRDEQRAEAALQHAGGDEDVGRRRQRARDRGQREAGDADDEDAAAAEDVAEAAADDHEDGEGERVAGRPPLHGGGAAAQLVADGRGGDGDDGAVEEIHDLGDEHDGEHDPAPAVGGRLVARARGRGRWERRRRWRTLRDSGGSGERINEHCSLRTLYVTNAVRVKR